MGPAATVLIHHVPTSAEIEVIDQMNDNLETSLNYHFYTPETDEYSDFPLDERQEISSHTSFQIASWYLIYAAANNENSHFDLAHACLRIARATQGLIYFQGALMPELPDHLRQRRWTQNSPTWSEVEPYFSEMTSSIPGRIITIPYEIANEEMWAYHIGDVEFMENWLAHPQFHMIK